jgi:hypothetical protein
MSYNPNWNKWLIASAYKHFEAVLEAAGVPYYIEGTSDRPLDNATQIEIRVDGPSAEEHTKNDFTLYIEVNLLVQTAINPGINIYTHAENQGLCASAITEIPVYKLGNDAGDDASQIGCLKPYMPEPRDRIHSHNYGQIETDVKLQHATVEGHFKIELTG